jgi:aminoglycoside phosphotransferase
VRSLLAPLGVPPASVHLRVHAYRPGRRAVVEVETAGRRLFLKVVRPRNAAALQERHRVVAGRLKSPASHGWSTEHGILVLSALPGRTLRDTLAAGAAVPAPAAVADLLCSIPDIDDGTTARSAIDTALGHAPLLTALVPADAPLIEELRRALSTVERTGDPRPIHGDFHAAQVMVEEGVVSGLLDLDTAGLGDPVADWATLVGHLHASIELTPAATRKAVARYTADILELARSRIDGDALAAHVAAVAFGLATGPFRVQMPGWYEEMRRRLRLAALWARLAGFAIDGPPDEKELIGLSDGVHARASV